MLPFDPQFRQITNECRQVGKLRWAEVFTMHELSEDEIEMLKREDLEKGHWGNGY